MSKEQTRQLMPPDMLEVADDLKATFGAKMTYLKVGDVEFGTPPERGYTDFILLDWERKQKEKEKNAHRLAKNERFL